MALSSTSRVQVRYIKESSFAVTPTVGNPRDLRITGESLNFNLEKVSSEEINNHRAASSMVAVNAESSGSLNYELSYAEYDPLIEGVLQSEFKPFVNTVGGSVTLNLADGEFTTVDTLVLTVADPAIKNLAVGTSFTVSGTGTANDGLSFTVVSVSSDTTIVVDNTTAFTPSVFTNAAITYQDPTLGVVGDITATTITASAPTTGSGAFTNLLPGQWFVLRGTSTDNDDKILRVSKTTPPTDTVITLDTNTPAVPSSGVSIDIRTSRLSNGNTQPSFSLERVVGDVGEYFLFPGMTPSSFSLNIASGSLTTGDISFMGKSSKQQNSSMLPSGIGNETLPSKSYDIMSGVSGSICAMWLKGSPLTGTYITSIGFSYDNSLRAQNSICSLGAIGIGAGTINCTISIETYFASGALFYNEFLKNENLELVFTAFDNVGNGYVFTMPKCNISTYTVNAGGKDQDLMASLELTALIDLGAATDDLRKVIFIDRVGDVVEP